MNARYFYLIAVLLLGGAWHRFLGPGRFYASDEPALSYDPNRDSDHDLTNAKSWAKQGHKRILLVVGGNWCVWCARLDAFFAANPDITSFRDSHFVMVKIYSGMKGKRPGALARLPKVSAYPHFFILDEDAAVLQSKDTDEFESGPSYDHDRLLAFLKTWAPEEAAPR